MKFGKLFSFSYEKAKKVFRDFSMLENQQTLHSFPESVTTLNSKL